MSLVNINGLFAWPPIDERTNFGFSVTPLIDAANEKWAVIFNAPKTGNIDRVGFGTRTVATGATVDVRLETVDDTTGDPTGTLVGVNTNASQVIADADDNKWFEVTLTAAAAVTKNQKLALVVANPGASFGNMIISALSVTGSSFPYGDLYTGTWAKSTLAIGNISIRYDDVTYPPIKNIIPVSATVAVALNTGTTPDEIGNLFSVPFSCRVVGWWNIISSAGTTRDFNIVLYDSDGTTALETYVQDANDLGGTGAVLACGLFANNHILRVGAGYRISCLPQTASSNTVSGFSVNAAALMDMLPGGQSIYRTQRTDAGAWSQTTTDRIFIGVLIDQLDDGIMGRITRAGGIIQPVY